MPQFNNFTLCHGITGSIEMLTAVAPLLADPDLALTYRQQAIDRMLTVKPKGGSYVSGHVDSVDEDTSLFMGKAGIGYICLRLALPNVPSLLLPTVEPTGLNLPDSLPIQQVDWGAVRVRILGSRYARTLGLLHAVGQILIPQLTDVWADEQLSLRTFVTEVSEELNPDAKAILDETWQLDCHKAEVCNALNPVFELAKWQHLLPTLSTLQILKEEDFGRLTLRPLDLFHLMPVRYDWNQPASVTMPTLPVLLPTPVYAVTWGLIDQVRELRVLTLGGLVLEAFPQPVLVVEAWENIKEQFDAQSPGQLRILRQRLDEQTRFFVQKGMLSIHLQPKA